MIHHQPKPATSFSAKNHAKTAFTAFALSFAFQQCPQRMTELIRGRLSHFDQKRGLGF